MDKITRKTHQLYLVDYLDEEEQKKTQLFNGIGEFGIFFGINKGSLHSTLRRIRAGKTIDNYRRKKEYDCILNICCFTREFTVKYPKKKEKEIKTLYQQWAEESIRKSKKILDVK